MLEDPAMFRIHIVPFSMDAIQAFHDTHADIVILDTSLFLPFEYILDQMYQYNWPFHVLLISHEPHLDYPKKDNVFLLDKDTLSKELFHEIIERIRQHSSSLQHLHTDITFHWNGTHSVTIHPDSYHIVILRTFDEDHALDAAACHTLIAKAHPFCNLHLIHASDSIAILYMNRSQIKKEFHYTQLSSLVFQMLGPKTAMLYKENISWKTLQTSLEEMVDRIPLLYFLQGESKSFQTLQQSAYMPARKDIKKQFLLLLQNLLDSDIESAKHILRDMYMHTIKASYDVSVLEYVRMYLQTVSFLFFKESLDFAGFPSMEEELAWLLDSGLFTPITFPSSSLQDTVTKCTITLYREYHTTISLDGVAGKLGLHKVYVNRLFKQQFRQTVAESLHILRLQEAKYLLLFTDEKVYNIAASVGFNDTGYFIKTFRKSTGYSALEFRLLRENKEEFRTHYARIMEI